MRNPGVSKSFNQNNNLGVLPAAAVVVAAPVVTKAVQAVGKIKALKKVFDGIKSFIGKLPFGGVTQDRFFSRYFAIRDIFVNGKYLVVGSKFHEEALTGFKIRKTQVEDKKKTGSYAPEFERLRQWVIYVLNSSNGGLGNYFGTLIPEFKMANGGNIYGDYVTAIKDIVTAFPPGTYTPELAKQIQLELSKIPDSSLPKTTVEAPPTGEGIAAVAVDGYKVYKDLDGAILQIRDASNQLIPQGSTAYNSVASKAQPGVPPTEAQAAQAGIASGTVGKILGAAAGVSLLVYLGSQMSGPKKPLGDLNTAKTKKGREAQRKAVFARLAEANELKPRKKSKKKRG